MSATLKRLAIAAATASTAVLVLVSLAHAQSASSSRWSSQNSSVPGVKGGYHIATTDPNRRDDRIGSSDSGGAKLGNWDVRTWGDISFGVGASSGNQKSGH